MARYKPMLTDEQWKKVEPLLPEFPRSAKGGPKPINNRDCFEGILWVLRSGARWKDLPDSYPSASTCWRRLRDWEECDVWLTLWRVFLAELDEQGKLDWEQVFADGSFAPAKKGASAWEKPNVEKVRSGWWWQTARVFLSECDLPRPHRRK